MQKEKEVKIKDNNASGVCSFLRDDVRCIHHI